MPFKQWLDLTNVIHVFQKTRSDVQDPVLYHLSQIKGARSMVKPEYLVPKSLEYAYTHQEAESYKDLKFSYKNQSNLS